MTAVRCFNPDCTQTVELNDEDSARAIDEMADAGWDCTLDGYFACTSDRYTTHWRRRVHLISKASLNRVQGCE
jgi:hypothetical protein